MSAMTAVRERRARHVPAAPVEEAADAPVVVGTHVDRLVALAKGMVPAALDHSACTHEKTAAARRICRREHVTAAKAAGGGTVVRVFEGEEWVPLLYVRAEALHVAERNSHCDDGLNATFKRLGMPSTNRSSTRGGGSPFDVTLEIEAPAGGTYVRTREEAQITITARVATGQIHGELLEYRRVPRTVVTEEEGVEVSRETKNVIVMTVRFHGRYNWTYNDNPRTDDAKTTDFKRWLSNRARIAESNATVKRTISQNWTATTANGVDDTALLETYRKLVGTDRYSY